jgi:hypothetical protein
MKDLIILVFYLNVDGMSPQRVLEQVSDLKQVLAGKGTLDDKFNMKHYIMPVRNQPTKVECIYPVLLDQKELVDKAIKSLESIEALADLWSNRESKF